MLLINTLAFLLGVYSTTCNAIQLLEAEQLALESSGQMLPPKKLTKIISEQLGAIRKVYPDMEEVHHKAKWVAGELLISISPEDTNTIRTVNESRYGPVKSANLMGKTENAEYYHLKFAKPYNPERLSERLKSELGIQGEANSLIGDGDDIIYHASAPTYSTYTFKMGWGDCPAECIYKHFWEFSVAPSQETLTVKLEKEYGSDLSSRKVVQ